MKPTHTAYLVLIQEPGDWDARKVRIFSCPPWMLSTQDSGKVYSILFTSTDVFSDEKTFAGACQVLVRAVGLLAEYQPVTWAWGADRLRAEYGHFFQDTPALIG